MSQEINHLSHFPNELYLLIFKDIHFEELFLLWCVSKLFNEKIQIFFENKFPRHFSYSDIQESNNWLRTYRQAYKEEHSYYQYPLGTTDYHHQYSFDADHYLEDFDIKENTPFLSVHKKLFTAVKEGFLGVILDLINSGEIEAKDLFVRNKRGYSAMNLAAIFPDPMISQKMLEILSELLKKEKSENVKIEAYRFINPKIYYVDGVYENDRGPLYFFWMVERISNELIAVGCPIVFEILFELFKEDNVPKEIKTQAHIGQIAHVIRLDFPQFLDNTIVLCRDKCIIEKLLNITNHDVLFQYFIFYVSEHCKRDKDYFQRFVSAKKSHDIVLNFLLENNRQEHFVQYAILCMDSAIAEGINNAEIFKFVCQRINENVEGAKIYFQEQKYKQKQMKTDCEYLKAQYEKNPQVWHGSLTQYVKLLVSENRLQKEAYEELRLVLLTVKLDNEYLLTTVLSNGADPDIPDPVGNTPLLIAVHYKKNNLAFLLLEKGANLHCKNRHGLSPLKEAEKVENTEFMDYLKEKGYINLDTVSEDEQRKNKVAKQ